MGWQLFHDLSCQSGRNGESSRICNGVLLPCEEKEIMNCIYMCKTICPFWLKPIFYRGTIVQNPIILNRKDGIRHEKITGCD